MAASRNAVQESRRIVITRLIDAPRALVFRAWTRPEHLMHWWGPSDFTSPVCEVDVRPGGAWRTCIRSPTGDDYWMRGRYREVVEPERLVFTFAWEESGVAGDEMLVTVTLEDVGGRTRLTFDKAPLPSEKEHALQEAGWRECLARLDAYLARAVDV